MSDDIRMDRIDADMRLMDARVSVLAGKLRDLEGYLDVVTEAERKPVTEHIEGSDNIYKVNMPDGKRFIYVLGKMIPCGGERL